MKLRELTRLLVKVQKLEEGLGEVEAILSTEVDRLEEELRPVHQPRIGASQAEIDASAEWSIDAQMALLEVS